MVSVVVDNLSALEGMRYSTVLADPPWRYANKATENAAEKQYRTLTVDEIAALPVQDLLTDNAHLHLWTTNGFLFEAKRVMEAWGFTYKSCLVWVKPQMGMGNYWRVSHEFLLFGLRGKCPFRSKSLMSWFQHSRGRHSAKPPPVRGMVEQASPGPYLELYGREPVTGWTVFGDQVGVACGA